MVRANSLIHNCVYKFSLRKDAAIILFRANRDLKRSPTLVYCLNLDNDHSLGSISYDNEKYVYKVNTPLPVYEG